MNRKFVFIGFLMSSLMTYVGASLTMAATYDVDMGNMDPPCGS